MLNDFIEDKSLEKVLTISKRREKREVPLLSEIMLSSENDSDYDVTLALIPDDSVYAGIEIPEEKKQKIVKQMKAIDFGPVSTVSMVCTGDQCSNKMKCPYFKEKVAPVGEECLVEKQLSINWFKRYIEEFNIDINRRTEVELASELVELDIYEYRLSTYISINMPFLTQEDIASVDEVGNEHRNTNISKVFEIKERIKKQRMKIYDAMIATREQKTALILSSGKANSLDRYKSLRDEILEYAKTRTK